MPTLNQIRAAIKAKIETVDAVGVVHEYEPYSKEAGELRDLYRYGTPARLFGWHIRRRNTREYLEDVARWRTVVSWRIRGFMSLDEGSQTEKLFDLKVEEIRDAFRADDDLGGLIFSCIDPSSSEVGIQVVDSSPVLFAGVLCHSAELGLATQHLH